MADEELKLRALEWAHKTHGLHQYHTYVKDGHDGRCYFCGNWATFSTSNVVVVRWNHLSPLGTTNHTRDEVLVCRDVDGCRFREAVKNAH